MEEINSFFDIVSLIEDRFGEHLRNDPLGYGDFFVVEHYYGAERIKVVMTSESFSESLLSILAGILKKHRGWTIVVQFPKELPWNGKSEVTIRDHC